VIIFILSRKFALKMQGYHHIIVQKLTREQIHQGKNRASETMLHVSIKR
jgi:hypothetical protein